MKKSYGISVDCANCAALMERAVNKIKGVKSASVGFFIGRMTVEFEAGADEKKLLTEIRRVCGRIDPDFELENE